MRVQFLRRPVRKDQTCFDLDQVPIDFKDVGTPTFLSHKKYFFCLPNIE